MALNVSWTAVAGRLPVVVHGGMYYILQWLLMNYAAAGVVIAVGEI